MRKHGKHALSRRRRRLGVAAALGGAAALVATFPGSPAHASPLPGTGVGQASDSAAADQSFDHFHPRAALSVIAAAAAASHYQIKSGDTLGGIAGQFCGDKGKYPNLAGANHLANPNVIIAGASLDASQRACNHAPAVYRAPVTTTAVTRPHRHAYTAARPQYHSSYAAPGTYSYAGLERLWVSAGGPAWAESHAAEIAICESGGRSNAYNPSGATGLWQILGSVVPGNLYDPMVNAENAVSKFKASGDTFAQWVCQ